MAIAIVIEDDLSLAKLYLEVMKQEGLGATLALDGRYALDLLSNEQPDVIVLDLMLPEISGYEVLRYIRQAPHLKDAIVVISTAHYMMEPDVYEMADHVLVKPVHLQELRDIARDIA